LQRLEAADSSRGSKSGDGSSSGSFDTVLQLQKRARYPLPLVQALDKDEVLDEVFSFVGRQEWLYAGGVCRRWRGRYLSMCYKAVASKYTQKRKQKHCCLTSHSSTFTTAARFALALESGLTLPVDSQGASRFFYNLPMLSQEPIGVLTLARVRGAAWHENMCSGAAYYGEFELLKWLHTSGCPWDPHLVATNAIRGQQRQHEPMLPWLLGIIEEWSQEDKNKLLFETGTVNDVKSLKLMLIEGAEWPVSFAGEHIAKGESVRAC
jgi:hypothetical protein